MLYRTIKTDTWRDPWFHALKPESKCLFLYLFTNPVISACGSMEISMGQIAFDVGMPVKKVEAEIASFGDKVFWIPESSILVVRNFFRHQRSQSSANYTIAAKRAMDALPEKARVWLIAANPELKDTHPHPIPIPSPSQGDKGKGEEEGKGKGNEEGKEEEEGSKPTLPQGDSDESGEYPEDFELDFWQHYPKGRGAKLKAFQHWKKMSQAQKRAAVAALPAFLEGRDWIEGFHKAPDIWLRDRLWENPPPPMVIVYPDHIRERMERWDYETVHELGRSTKDRPYPPPLAQVMAEYRESLRNGRKNGAAS